MGSRIIPAYAGSTFVVSYLGTRTADHPRIRGEHSCADWLSSAASGSSPHTRGARASGEALDRRGRIIPAYAGSTRTLPLPAAVCQDHPRIRGEHQPLLLAELRDRGSSPHTRGARPRSRTVRRSSRIIPAYAGSTSPTPPRSPTRTDHPRIRGEHWSLICLGFLGAGSSPHTRGALPPAPQGRKARRIIPAYAGSTPAGRRPRRDHPDHPRIRGEHYLRRHKGEKHAGSSPHTRGAHRCARRRRSPSRIIPAYAGSTSVNEPIHITPPDHPRIRGEHLIDRFADQVGEGSSPHTRGAPLAVPKNIHVRRIIPAYAGSTRCAALSTRGARDHPRIRGEHA